MSYEGQSKSSKTGAMKALLTYQTTNVLLVVKTLAITLQRHCFFNVTLYTLIHFWLGTKKSYTILNNLFLHEY